MPESFPINPAFIEWCSAHDIDLDTTPARDFQVDFTPTRLRPTRHLVTYTSVTLRGDGLAVGEVRKQITVDDPPPSMWLFPEPACRCDCGPRALRDAADLLDREHRPTLTTRQTMATWLRARADELEADHG